MASSRGADNVRPQSIYSRHLFTASRVSTTIRQSYQQTTVASNADSSATTRVLIATTANHSLSGLSAIDGIAPVAGDRILAWFQSTPSQNGIYIADSGAWSRADDGIVAGMLISVMKGTDYDNALFMCSNDADPVVGTDAITFVLAGGEVDGSGTADTIAKFSDPGTLTDSQIIDDGTQVTIGGGTGGLLNVLRNHAADAAIYAENTDTGGAGDGIVAATNSAAGNAVLGIAAGATSVGVWGEGPNVGTGGHTTDDGVGIYGTSSGSGYAAMFESTAASADAAVLIDDNHAGGGGALRANTNASGAKILQATGQYQERFSVDYDGHAHITASDGGPALLVDHLANGEMLRLDEDGDVSIGTAAAPTARLDVENASSTMPTARFNQTSTDDILVLEDGGSAVWSVKDGGTIDSTGCGEVQATRTVSAAATIGQDDRIIFVDTAAASGNVVLTLPTPVAGRRLTIVDIGDNAGANRVILSPGTGVQVDITAANTNKGVLINNGDSAEVFAASTTLWWTAVTPRAL